MPFSSERKWSAVAFDGFTLVVGAPEKLAGRAAAGLVQDLLKDGKRVLLVGITREAVQPKEPLPLMEWLGTIVIADKLRPDAVTTLEYFKREGVDLKLISGDNPEAVSALAAQAGFPDCGRYIDMSGVTDDADIELAAANCSHIRPRNATVERCVGAAKAGPHGGHDRRRASTTFSPCAKQTAALPWPRAATPRNR